MRTLPIAIMRGGTSKGVFVRDEHLPPMGPARDALLLALMGSPDPMQLDGLGGTHSSTSKVVTVAPSRRADCDVDYLFAQVDVERPVVDWAGNCGNLTTAVGPYAIQQGLLAAREPITEVRLWNLNTNVRVIARVPVRNGQVLVEGDCVVPGVPGSGAPIVTDYVDPTGAVLGALLPTGNAVDQLHVDGKRISASIIDVAGPVVFIRSSDAGVADGVDPSIVNRDPATLDRLEMIRDAAAVLVGLAPRPGWAHDESPGLPRLALVSSPRPENANAHLLIRVMSMQRMHHACPMTVHLCACAAVHISGTIPAQVAHAPSGPDVTVAHPKGSVAAHVTLRPDGGIAAVSLTRTARCLLAGDAFIRELVREPSKGTTT